jgi:aspartate carbamoyltransferase regulatory subunit
LISPKATINIIRDFEVAEKFKVKLPKEIVGIVCCSNPTCISNANEPVKSRFRVISQDPAKIKCYYCEREPDDIAERII